MRLYTSDRRMSVEQWWNDTDRGNWNTGRKILYNSVVDEWMRVDHWWDDTDSEKPQLSKRNLSLCHFVHHKYHTCWPGTNSGFRGEILATNNSIPGSTPQIIKTCAPWNMYFPAAAWFCLSKHAISQKIVNNFTFVFIIGRNTTLNTIHSFRFYHIFPLFVAAVIR
jgi:hypothetical protein